MSKIDDNELLKGILLFPILGWVIVTALMVFQANKIYMVLGVLIHGICLIIFFYLANKFKNKNREFEVIENKKEV